MSLVESNVQVYRVRKPRLLICCGPSTAGWKLPKTDAITPPQHQQPCDAVNATSILARGAHSIAPTRHPRGHHPMQRRSDGIGACAGAGPLRFGSVTDGGNWDDLHSAADCVNTDSLFLLRIFLNYHRSSRDSCNACSVKFHARFKLSKKIARLFYQAPVFCEPSNQPPD